ncbi:hypothetical protein Q0590_25340 [Rhodocytophaga aerolata]|uniref:Uncharacterized protein n=1 Tax=Rhodocytophaga aerolata TaxID=455078 RepID=A0ABT8RBY9_9BACT|nr:hypothetical protein [Rhodocytophaga aerolata]MDO1449627.1 hypothetical protein [Rhodocytophaga aerolata]
MDSYKFTVTEDRFGSKSSYTVLIKILGEIYGKPHNQEIGFMYRETDTFPKEYYFNTSNKNLLNAITMSYKVEQTNYPANFINSNDFHYLGNADFFPPKLQ